MSSEVLPVGIKSYQVNVSLYGALLHLKGEWTLTQMIEPLQSKQALNHPLCLLSCSTCLHSAFLIKWGCKETVSLIASIKLSPGFIDQHPSRLQPSALLSFRSCWTIKLIKRSEEAASLPLKLSLVVWSLSLSGLQRSLCRGERCWPLS